GNMPDPLLLHSLRQSFSTFTICKLCQKHPPQRPDRPQTQQTFPFATSRNSSTRCISKRMLNGEFQEHSCGSWKKSANSPRLSELTTIATTAKRSSQMLSLGLPQSRMWPASTLLKHLAKNMGRVAPVATS